MQKTFCLEVSGDLACFTRPEMKVERVSYDVITPSAARAIFESILWKPAILWRVTKIEVLRPIRWASVRRNEVGQVATAPPKKLMREGGQVDPLGFFIEEKRQQRAGLLLRDVKYRLYAHFELTPHAGPDDTAGKFLGQFERRAEAGQCINQPYLGCREFACSFRLLNNPASEPEQPIAETRDLGFMVYDTCSLDARIPAAKRQYELQLFRAKMENGVINVPAWDSKEVRR